MTITIKSNPDGVSGAIQVNGNDAVVIGTQGITQGAPFSFRNKIINGKMEIAQRGTSFPAIASSAYSLDRWVVGSGGTTGVVTVSQESDGYSISNLNYLKAAVTTADSSTGSSDVFVIRQFIEGRNARSLAGNTFTLSFSVKSSKIGTHCVAFRNSGPDQSYVAEYTIKAANTWERKSVTVPGGLITAGTWDWSNGRGLDVAFVLMAGSSTQTTAGAWQTGSYLATSAQVNCLDTVGNIFAITGVQLEAGSVATPFEHRPYGTELALCQRYFELTTCSAFMGNTANGFFEGVNCNFKVQKRATPTIAVVNFIQNTNIVTNPYSEQPTVHGFRSMAQASGSNCAWVTEYSAASEL